MPFLENVTRGRGIPRERLLGVAEHYHHFGGKSPINDQNRALIAALEPVVTGQLGLPIYWGNRNWHPMLADTLRQMRDDGIRHAVAFVTSAFGSYSGCRQYRNNIAAARAEVGEGAPEITQIRPFWSHPGFLDAMTDRVREAREKLPEARLVYTAHSGADVDGGLESVCGAAPVCLRAGLAAGRCGELEAGLSEPLGSADAAVAGAGHPGGTRSDCCRRGMTPSERA